MNASSQLLIYTTYIRPVLEYGSLGVCTQCAAFGYVTLCYVKPAWTRSIQFSILQETALVSEIIMLFLNKDSAISGFYSRKGGWQWEANSELH